MAWSRPAVAARRGRLDVGHSGRNLSGRLAPPDALDVRCRLAGIVRWGCASRRVYDARRWLFLGSRSDWQRCFLAPRPEPEPVRCNTSHGPCGCCLCRCCLPGSRSDVGRCAPVWPARDHHSARFAIHQVLIANASIVLCTNCTNHEQSPSSRRKWWSAPPDRGLRRPLRLSPIARSNSARWRFTASFRFAGGG